MPPSIEIVVGPAGVIYDKRAGLDGVLTINLRVVLLIEVLKDYFPVSSDQKSIYVSVVAGIDISMN